MLILFSDALHTMPASVSHAQVESFYHQKPNSLSVNVRLERLVIGLVSHEPLMFPCLHGLNIGASAPKSLLVVVVVVDRYNFPPSFFPPHNSVSFLVVRKVGAAVLGSV